MTSEQIKKEWQKLTNEIHNKPKVNGHYPLKLTRLREILLFAEVALNKIDDRDNVDFYNVLYQKVMEFYYQQKRCLNNYF